MMMGNQLLGTLFVLLSAACFATAAIMIKFAYELSLTTWQILAFQSFSASFILMLITVMRRKKVKLSFRELRLLALQGAVGSLGTSVAFFFALQYVEASLAAVLLYTYPVFVTLGSILFLRRGVDKQQIIAIVLAVAGTVLVLEIGSIGSFNWSTFGVLLGVLSGITYAFYNLMGEVVLVNQDSFTVTAVTQFASTIALVVVRPQTVVLAATGSIEGWLVGVLLAVITSIIPFFLLLQGIKFLGAAKSAIISTFELPMTMLLSYSLLGEAISFLQVIGALLVLFGIIVLQGPAEEDAKCAAGT